MTSRGGTEFSPGVGGKPRLREVIQRLVEFTELGVHCRIAGDDCTYTQKKYNPENFCRHFRKYHPNEAVENGLAPAGAAGPSQKPPSPAKTIEEIIPDTESELTATEVQTIPEFESKDFQRDFSLGDNSEEYGKTYSYPEESLAAPGVLNAPETSETFLCEERDTKPLIVTEVQTIQGDESKDFQRDLPMDDNNEEYGNSNSYSEESLPTPGVFNASQTSDTVVCEESATKSNRAWYKDFVRPWILVDSDGAHCRIQDSEDFAADPCSYTQQTLRLQNFLRHFRGKHKLEARQKGLFSRDGQNDPAQQQEEDINASEQMETVEAIEQESILKESPAEQNGEAPQDNNTVYSKRKREYKGRYKKALNYIHQDAKGAHCRIRGDLRCPYRQKTLRLTNFVRHFWLNHPREFKEKRLSWRTSPKEDSGDEKSSDEVAEKVKEFSVVKCGLAQIDDGGAVCCSIEPDSLCQYRQEKYDDARFLAHFRLKHSYLGDVLFPSDGATIPDQLDHITIGEDGLFCSMAPDSGCTYFQTSYNEQKFKEHFRLNHSDLCKAPRSRNKTQRTRQSVLFRMLRPYIHEDQLGVHCRISDDAGCDYVQSRLLIKRLLHHFLVKHRREATRKGLAILQSTFVKKKERFATYQSYHLQKKGLVLTKTDGFYCSQPSCDFHQKTYAESIFLDHLRQNHPASCVYLKSSKQKLSMKAKEHIFEDEEGFHCRLSADCHYMQPVFRVQNYCRHFRNVVHKKDYFWAGFVLRREPRPAVPQPNKEVELERYVEQEQEDSCEEFLQRDSEGKSRRTGMYAMVRKNVTADSHGIHCRIADPLCGYVQKVFRGTNFWRHFCKCHPEEARAKGFFTKARPRDSSESSAEEEESEEEMIPNPAEFCRLCSSTDQPLEPIFKDILDANPLLALIELFTGITLTVDADSLACICKKCRKKLDDMQRFREHCQSFDSKVRRKAADVVVVVAGVEHEQSILPLDAIKKEEPVEVTDDDPLVGGAVSTENPADIEEDEDELPYERVSDDLLKCRYCEWECQSLAGMMDHFQETHSRDVMQKEEVS